MTEHFVLHVAYEPADKESISDVRQRIADLVAAELGVTSSIVIDSPPPDLLAAATAVTTENTPTTVKALAAAVNSWTHPGDTHDLD